MKRAREHGFLLLFLLPNRNRRAKNFDDLELAAKVQFENEEFKDEKEIEKMSGYNNAIVSILECINPIYLYDIND